MAKPNEQHSSRRFVLVLKVLSSRTPKGMFFGGFLLLKTNQKAFLWVSWLSFYFFKTNPNKGFLRGLKVKEYMAL